MTQVDANKETVRRFFDAMNRADGDAIINAYADDGYVWTMGNTLISGKKGKADIKQAADAVLGVFPRGLAFTITGMTAEGNRVAVEAESYGEHASGRVYQNMYHFLFEFDDAGKLKVLKEYMDTERVTDVLCGGQRPA